MNRLNKGKRVNKKVLSKKEKNIKLLKALLKITLYAILAIVSYGISIKLANNFLLGLEKIIEFGQENLTKVFFGILLLLVTKVVYIKK